MAERALVRQEIIDGDTLNVLDLRCPGCKNNTLVLSGQAMLPQKEIMEAGKIVDQIVGDYEDGAFDLERIDCLSCNTQYIIKDRKILSLETENANLKQRLNDAEGKRKYMN